jgi:hypothetical protein
MAPKETGSGVAIGLAVIFDMDGLTVGETVIWAVSWTVAWAEAFFFLWCLTVEPGVVDGVGPLTAGVGVEAAFCALTIVTPAKMNSTNPKVIVLFIIPLLEKILQL